jgi:hypothetical protein
MTEKTYWNSFKAESETVISKLKGLIHEGNVRRVVIQHQGRTVAEFPLTAGVVGAVLAPVLAAIGALVALLHDCTIQVERSGSAREERSQTAARSLSAGIVSGELEESSDDEDRPEFRGYER